MFYHMWSHVLLLNSTSLLAVTYPCKKQEGGHFGVLNRNVEIAEYNLTQANQLWIATGQN